VIDNKENMSRETLKEFLISRGSTADSISYGNVADENSSGDIDRGDDLGIDPNTGEQLVKLTESDRGLLGDYVNYISSNYRRGNKYTIKGGNKQSNSHERGSSVQAAESSSDSDVFANKSTTLGDTLSGYSNSGNFESSEAGLSSIIDKTSDNRVLDGHTLLNIEGDDINTAGSTNPGTDSSDHRLLKQMTSEMLKRNNRFSPGARGKQYSKNRIEQSNDLNEKEIAKSQNSFGENTETGSSFIQEKLRSIGPSLLLKAAGLDLEDMNIDPDEIDEATLKKAPKYKVTTRELEASTAFNSPVDRDNRGAFDQGASSSSTTVHNLPGSEFTIVNSAQNKTLLKEFSDVLKDYAVENEQSAAEHESGYVIYDYKESVLRFLSVTLEDENMTDDNKAFFANISRSVLREEPGVKRDEKVKKFCDVFSTLGNTDMILYRENGEEKNRLWDVNSLKDGPATRVSKSRSNNGFTEKSLAWRASSMPSMYHMPMSILRSVQQSGTIADKNPVKAMLGSSLGEKTYLAQNLEADYEQGLVAGLTGVSDRLMGDADNDTSRNKIPKEMVNIYEDMLDAEYVPFYFHDLRTNEIVAFHAFLSSLSDSFQATHTNYEGYGRIDDVLIYKNTKRSISGKFTLVATSKEDFDEMWFKVNKLVELLYPQWSNGDVLKSLESETSFIKPFTQIPAISPMIRLRIGDVIRGNYSRFNLGRLFGSGHVETHINATSIIPTSVGSVLSSANGESNEALNNKKKADDFALQAFMSALGTPLQFLDIIPDDSALSGEIKRVLFDTLSSVLDNGFVSPLVHIGLNKLKDPDQEKSLGKISEYGPTKNNKVLIRPSNGKLLYYNENTKKPIVTDRFLKAKIESVISSSENKTKYVATIIEPTSQLKGDILLLSFEDIIVDPDHMFKNYFAYFLDPIVNGIGLLQDELNSLAAENGIMGDSIDLFTTTFEDFMSPYNNTITKAFEDSAGRGLAGFIGKLSYELIGEKIPWEIDHGSRAPKMLEISFDFKPVHDIAPGLDADGFSRAPVYNVGTIVNNISGDQQGQGTGSKNRYNFAAKDSTKIHDNE